MATGNGSFYITAGFPVHKDSGQSPTGNGSVFITAGLLKEQESATTLVRHLINGTLANDSPLFGGLVS